MSPDLAAILARHWGYHTFRPLQREAMEAILAARDSLVVLPTGGGKSLCFQAPALVRPNLALVVSPLISLMKDQVDALAANGVPAACYNSALPQDRKAEVIAGIRTGRYRLLYVSPERLLGEGGDAFRALLGDVSFVAIDEAHCISQWGHDFRPEYRQLGRLRDFWPRVSLHAFTATATARVRRDIAVQLGLRDPSVLVGDFDRPNLVYRVLPRANLKRQLLEILARHPGQAGIIYCTSRREVDALAGWLASTGVRARPYHAGLADEERHRNQDAFLNEEADIIVATVAFGMGIDRSDVRFVVHAGAPQSLEHYQQESGRAGRDGLEAECVLLYSTADVIRWRTMFERAGELTESRRMLLREMERYAAGVGCRHRRLVAYFGQSYARERCDACDYCLGELEPVADPADVARKILSCVARVGQRFGAAHVTSVLRGSTSEQVSARRHHELSTFGLLEDAPVAEVRGYIEQLVAAGHLHQPDEPMPVLRLTNRGIALLKDPAADPGLSLVRQRRPSKDRVPRASRAEAESWRDVDRELFERLRAVRLQIARARGVPPYVIFHDTTLRELARLKPTTVAALQGVYGIGARKAEDLGELVIDAIRAHQAP
ncbi:MAG TPA: DNA helicase RecQ [Vicinamibacterales bacterium]|nr:DNA helicase RecQ [Vicinamibacterales bacterium]